jgi:hypothetical protein
MNGDAKPKAALIAQTLRLASDYRKTDWAGPFAMNPRWIARRLIRKARLIRLLCR